MTPVRNPLGDQCTLAYTVQINMPTCREDYLKRYHVSGHFRVYLIHTCWPITVAALTKISIYLSLTK